MKKPSRQINSEWSFSTGLLLCRKEEYTVCKKKLHKITKKFILNDSAENKIILNTLLWPNKE